MKLTVRFSDLSMCTQEFCHTGTMPPVKYRTAVVELTPAQAAALAPRRLGSSHHREQFGGAMVETPIMETREVIALEDGEGE